MANVVRNPDNTLTITFLAWEQRLLVRWAAERRRTVVQLFEAVLNGVLSNKRTDYHTDDGRTRQEKYEALSPANQATVDALLNEGS